MTEENRFGRESYIRTVKLLAEELHEEVEKNGADLYEAASQSVENTDWIIYYYGCTKVLEHTNSPLALHEGILQLHAFYSMLEDVLNLYEMQAA